MNQSQILIGNRFTVKLRIISPHICKQCLQVKRWKAKARSEKVNSLKTVALSPVGPSVKSKDAAIRLCCGTTEHLKSGITPLGHSQNRPFTPILFMRHWSKKTHL